MGRTARGEGGRGHALLILYPEELAFLRFLKSARVPLNEFEFLWSKISDIQIQVQFLAPLDEGQRAIVMALCLAASVNFYKSFPQKLLTGFLPDFTGMFHWWSSFKFLQMIVFHEEFWLLWQPKKKAFKNLLPNH